MKVFGITGGVGAGKSEVLTYLGQNYDATVIQADEAGYLVMLPGGECYGEIVKLFGRQITTETGELDRKRIAEIVFQDEEKLKALNAIVHPAVKRYIKKAIAAAQAIEGVEVEVIASSKDENFNYVPKITRDMVDQDAAYLHITTNETIGGIAFNKIPDAGDVPIVADMSSNILSNDYKVTDFGVIYAGAQKNIGPSGLTVVIIRDDLLNDEPIFAPMLDYRIHAENKSMYNTPATYGIYIAKLVFEWLEEQGGVAGILAKNQEKAQLLYDAIDASDIFTSPVVKEDRSINNIPFVTGNDDWDKEFNKRALEAGMLNLKGHRSVGGMRASLYNAFPKEGVEALVALMQKFEEEKAGK